MKGSIYDTFALILTPLPPELKLRYRDTEGKSTMKSSRNKPPSPTPDHQDPLRKAERLDSGRLARLIARHDSALRHRDELLELKYSYKHSHEQATANPTTVDSIEQWNRHKASSAQLSNLAGNTLPELSRRIQKLESRACLNLQILISEGLPSSVWVGIGAGEYALVEHCQGEPVLRRAPLDAIRRAPEGTPPRIIEKHATQISRSRYRPVVKLTFLAVKAASLLFGMWAVLALFADLAAGQSSLHVPLLAVASLALYATAAFKSDLTPLTLDEVLSQDSLSEEPLGHDSNAIDLAERNRSEHHDPTPQQDATAKNETEDNRPGMRWS